MKDDLLNEVKTIIRENEAVIRDTGEGFNLISILGMEHNERYTHSAIIAELLTPDKNHFFGTRFLEEFLKIIKCDFPIDSVQILTEEYVGYQLESRTFLDIVIKNNINGNVILIENKIWAKDQNIQLERYHNAYKDLKTTIFYLTPFGSSYYSPKFENYRKISYHGEITEWINRCIEISKEAENPFMENSLKIYLNVINKITNQSRYDQMADNIFYKILESSENLEAAANISQQFNKIDSYIRKEFSNLLFQKINDKEEIESKYGIVSITITDDDDPFYLGIRLYDNLRNLIFDNLEFNSKIMELKSMYHKNKSQSNTWWNIWFYLSEESLLSNTHIHSLDAKNKIQLYKNLETQVNIVHGQFSDIITSFKILLKE